MKHLYLALLAAIGSANTATAQDSNSVLDIQNQATTLQDQELSLEQMFLNGTAVGVTRDGYIQVETAGESLAKPLRLRLWALQIEPEALAVMVLGRRLRCRIVYVTDDHTAGICSIGYQAAEGFRCSILDNIFCDGIMMGAVPIAELFGNSYRKCVTLDLQNLSSAYPPPNNMPSYESQCEFFQAETKE
jgi:hypothetical protein